MTALFAWRKLLSVALAAALMAAAGAAVTAPARAQSGPTVIDINNPTVEPIPIALPVFSAQSQVPSRLAEMTKMGEDMVNVVTADLERSGLFRPLPRTAYIEQGLVPDRRPRFRDWKAIGAQGLVVGSVNFLADGRVEVVFRLWDILREQQMNAIKYQTTPDNWRQISHRIADAIYQQLTGEEGYFDTRIVYVAETGPATQRVKRLAIMDQDGANNAYLTKGDFMALTPRFSPNSQEITYLSYFNNKPRVYMYNLETGKQELLGDFDGMTFAPRFSPDGNQVVMSLSKNGNTNIYLMDLRTRKIRQLTDGPDIDTAPSFSPDGQFITFESDRGGGQQIYVMNADGSGVKRISFGKGRYKTPVWSPRGDLIAFTFTSGGTFKIGVMRPDGSGERMLTESFLDEGPTWAPNGRVIMFFRGYPSRKGQTGKVELRSIDLTGRNERKVATPGDASDPAWSPLLK
jgi:TolB protein